MSSHGHTPDVPFEGILAIGLMVLILLVWVTIKAIELVARMLAAHPRSLGLWCALGSLLVGVLGAALVPNDQGPLLIVVGLSSLVLLGIAKTQELRDDPLLQLPRTRAVLVDQVLHQSWWNA